MADRCPGVPAAIAPTHQIGPLLAELP
jgi:hypothetical protein